MLSHGGIVIANFFANYRSNNKSFKFRFFHGPYRYVKSFKNLSIMANISKYNT